MGTSLKAGLQAGQHAHRPEIDVYSPSFLRSATLMLWWPPAMGVAVGPFRPTRVDFERGEHVVRNQLALNSASARTPASTRSHSIVTPVASTARTVASATSGPMPSPGISVTRWAITAIIEVRVNPAVIPRSGAHRGRRDMVERQLRRRAIRDKRVLAAMREIPREQFVPRNRALVAYADEPIPVGYGQTISQPYMTALMAESLELTGAETVLEVGAGCGYAAAVLGRSPRAWSPSRLFPRWPYWRARICAATGRDANVTVVEGDGSLGYPPLAPYDAISVAAGAPEIPAALLGQLRDPGRLVIPVGAVAATRNCACWSSRAAGWRSAWRPRADSFHSAAARAGE